ncbi:amidase [Zavarzinia sp. CC-PAN008]|uniref:amidase n=1 Tax=Zavarzinia sp. CC-PAN008 TaxID=3243332 RepID=UPI003F745E49
MAFAEYDQYDGLGLADLIRRGEVSPADVVEAAIARIEALNPQLNALVHKAYDEARRTRAADGPFGGVPFLIKDLACPVEGWPCTSGSHYFGDGPAASDGIMTRRFRGAGLVLLGTTNTPELGITGTTESGRLGPCRNPWNPAHITGGSSGGAAAAVASGMVPMAHASDGLGSIRIPAACCGLFGMKITRDRNPTDPARLDGLLNLAVDHAVTRTVRDSAALLDATAGWPGGTPFAVPPRQRPWLEEVATPPGRLRIAWSSRTPSGKPIAAEVEAALQQTVALLQGLGHEVVPHDLSVDLRPLYRAHRAVSGPNMRARLARRIRETGRAPERHELERLTWAIIEGSSGTTPEQVVEGAHAMRRLSVELLSLFDRFDVFLSPVLGTEPPPVGHIDPVTLDPALVNQRQAEAFPFTPPFNFTGQPAMSVPLAWSASGLPLGMQFAGRHGDEATLFRLAAQLEQAQPWIGRKPPVWGLRAAA